MSVGFTWLNDAIGKRWVILFVGGVWEHLGFQTACAAVPVFHSTFPRCFSIEEVASVKLHAGLVGVEFHGAPGLRVPENSGLTQTLTIYGPAVVVAHTKLQRDAGCLDAFPDHSRGIEVEGGVGYLREVACKAKKVQEKLELFLKKKREKVPKQLTGPCHRYLTVTAVTP